MYNTKYECRYNNDLESEQQKTEQQETEQQETEQQETEQQETEKQETEIIRDILYKEDLINIFEIDTNSNFNVFNDVISNLYEKIKKNVFLKECMGRLASKFMSIDEELGLCILYSFDFMYLTHKCVSEYLDNGLIAHENMTLLKNSIDNYFYNYVNN